MSGRRAAAAVACASLLSSCALPVVSAGTFLPAGDLQRGEVHASVSLEAGRVLVGPSDIDGLQRPEAAPFEVATWVASDVSLRYGLTDRVSLEAQAKLTNPVTPFAPELCGGAVGGRVRLFGHKGSSGVALEVGGRLVGVSVDQSVTRTNGSGTSQTDQWLYRAVGLEAPLIGTYRFNEFVAVTASPFLRAYWIRAVHTELPPGGGQNVSRLDYTPVLSGGGGVSVALDFGRVEVAPGVALELATRPGPGAQTTFLFEPGVSVGTRF